MGNAGTLVFNDYRGADTVHAYPIPVPYITHRGKLSLDATTPASSHDSDTRRGMPDLQPTFDIGPELDGHLWRSANGRWRVDLDPPIRRAITLTSHPSAIGWQAAPSLDLDVFDIGGHA
jgi:outer membrane protein